MISLNARDDAREENEENIGRRKNCLESECTTEALYCDPENWNTAKRSPLAWSLRGAPVSEKGCFAIVTLGMLPFDTTSLL